MGHPNLRRSEHSQACAAERAGDSRGHGQEGATVFTVSGTSTQRFVGVGTWTWALRGTDALGNVGAFSAPSNEVVVTATGVTVTPPPEEGQPGNTVRRALAVGWSCSAVDAQTLSLAWLVWALRRRRSSTS